ncbi:GGDEF domain-containing protein [Aestuariibacter halophilus]|uniref:diguanylate cyclase n=1 Tax=Fluctibacter halophilus TaxID=226011 RepID=A0ABS8GB84_9ALTE|nr:GGDEF domain-containing protein [Aestuariibacter halophilus]MCC2617802.1 GGDEF domain-containing protein [Aestuariibacter halophilus]
MNIEQLRGILAALPDPAFILSRSGKYVAVFGGRDNRYYHDGSSLVGKNLSDVLKPDKARWFLDNINNALQSSSMTIVEYELSDKDVQGLPDTGPEAPIWFEGRIQPLDFSPEDEPVVLWVASNISARHHLEKSLRYLSDTDQLTGLGNRRKLDHELPRQFANYLRYNTPASLIMLDLDNLKTINDAHGHQVGDKVIVAMADICRAELRQTDIACRFGGDEFVIILPNTDQEQAQQFATRIHSAFEQRATEFTCEDSNATVSIGVTSFLDTDASHEDTLRRADQFLYQAKHGGKNRVSML